MRPQNTQNAPSTQKKKKGLKKAKEYFVHKGKKYFQATKAEITMTFSSEHQFFSNLKILISTPLFSEKQLLVINLLETGNLAAL